MIQIVWGISCILLTIKPILKFSIFSIFGTSSTSLCSGALWAPPPPLPQGIGVRQTQHNIYEHLNDPRYVSQKHCFYYSIFYDSKLYLPGWVGWVGGVTVILRQVSSQLNQPAGTELGKNSNNTNNNGNLKEHQMNSHCPQLFRICSAISKLVSCVKMNSKYHLFQPMR